MSKKEKAVVLNSGGLDSTVLMHHLYNSDEYDLFPLFFNYGQPTVDKELRYAVQSSKATESQLKVMNLNLNFVGAIFKNKDKQYIPSRNLIFLSYAISFAETIGATKVFCAFINPGTNYYVDSSQDFIEAMNKYANEIGIEVVAPFLFNTKDQLTILVRRYGISADDFHSCNMSTEPCGECGDCKAIINMYEEVNKNMIMDYLVLDGGSVDSDIFEGIYLDHEVTNAKLYINEFCNMGCTHCFISLNKTAYAPLHIERKNIIVETLVRNGIETIDLFGKEVLYDVEDFREWLEIINMHPIKEVLMITNGLNLDKAIHIIKQYNKLKYVTVSVEDLKDSTYRNNAEKVVENIKLAIKEGIEVRVSLDINNSNQYNLRKIITKLYKIGVTKFYCKPIISIGESKGSDSTKIYLEDVITSLYSLNCKWSDIDIELILHISSVRKLQLAHPHINQNIMDNYVKYGKFVYTEDTYTDVGLPVDLELYCESMMNSITLLPSGEVLGCGYEVGNLFNTHKINNIFHTPLEDIVRRGKNTRAKVIRKQAREGKFNCYFNSK